MEGIDFAFNLGENEKNVLFTRKISHRILIIIIVTFS